MTSILLISLLALLPHGAHTRAIAARADTIAAQAQSAADAHGVPPEIVLAVGYLESRLGTDPRSGGSVGAPHDRRHRHLAGGWSQQASSLALGHRRCGAWLPALRHFRCGRCDRCPRLVGYTPEAAMRLAARMAMLR